MLARSYHQGRQLGGFLDAPGGLLSSIHATSWAGSLDAHGRGAGRSSIRQHQPGPRLFHPPGSNGQHHQAGGFLDAHGRGAGRSSIRRHQPAPPRPLGLFLGNPHSLGAANSWARVPGQQHYKFCNKCRVNIAREATGPTAGAHEAAGPLFSSWMLAPILTNTPRPLGLFLASSRPRQLGGFPGCSQLHYFFCNKYRGNTREASRAAALFHLGHQAGGFQAPWLSSGPRLPCIHATSWAGGSNFNGVGSNFNGVGSFSIFKRC